MEQHVALNGGMMSGLTCCRAQKERKGEQDSSGRTLESCHAAYTHENTSKGTSNRFPWRLCHDCNLQRGQSKRGGNKGP